MPQMTIDQAIKLALDHHRAGRFSEAEAIYRQVLAAEPKHSDALHLLGMIASQVGKFDEAVGLIRQAIASQPDNPDYYCNLGTILRDHGQPDQAIEYLQRALALRPEFPTALNNLGLALTNQDQLDRAIDCYQKAISIDPAYPLTHNNLALAWKEVGQLDRAVESHRQAMALNPDRPDIHGNLLYTLLYQPSCAAADYLRECQEWNRRFAQPLEKTIQPHANDRSPHRRLRIGYVSPDFRDHCQSRFTIPLLSHHDRQRFEIFCYSSAAQPDSFTSRLHALADTWRDVAGMSDEKLADLVRADQIDILVDLTAHMARNRMLVFARKPAPVQMTYLAYPATTGLAAMDYRLTDRHLDPPGANDADYSERSIHLPDSYWCFDPLTSEPSPGDLPALRNGFTTLGCLNNFCKVSDATLDLWGSCMTQNPNSHLLLVAPAGNHRNRVLERIGARGVAPDRIEFAKYGPWARYLELYSRIDLSLDPLPYNGHNTTLDSLWMGVPVITLPGNSVVARAGLSIMHNVGLPELIAHTPEQYVRIATTLASDLPRLSELRSTLRQRMQASPLTDAPRFARNLEKAYRQMWHSYLAGEPLFQIGS
jgi:protein O-GlcNAc transferase